LGKGKYSISKSFTCKLSLIQEQSIASVLAMASLQRYYIAGQEKTAMLKTRNKKHQANN
jgi:3'-phosphoadenosine 5'-phosphosulfate (PAPS) 3'-phosphatase